MRKIVLIASLILLLSCSIFAQLTGTKSIPGDYSTIAAAISALNSQGVGNGGVIFNVAAGYTETFTTFNAGTITTVTGSETHPIVFQKSGTGANPVITAMLLTGSGLTDGIIMLQGTDYVTFDGIDVKENPLNTSNMTEWGYAILMASPTDASQYIKISNCNITLNWRNRYSRGIFSRNQNSTSNSYINPAVPEGAVSHCDIDGCNITSVYEGISFTGYDDIPPFALCGRSNRFGFTKGNTITEFGGDVYASYGIFTSYQNGLVVANNIVNNGSVPNQTDITGINIGPSSIADVDIYNNHVTLTSYVSGGFSSIYGIRNYGSSYAGNNIVNIYGNIIENCNQTTATGSIWYLLWNSASALICNVHDNIIRNNSRPATGGQTFLICLYSSQSIGTENVYNNQVYGNSTTGPDGLNSMFGLFCNNHASVKNIYSNSIHDNSTNGSSIYGIYSSNYDGIDAGSITNIYQNTVYNQSITSATGVNSGIRINGGDMTYAYNNLISDLNAPASSNNKALTGISAEQGNFIGLYNNTLFLKGASTGADFGSTCVYANMLPWVELRNNILVNSSTPNGTGKSIAYWRESNSLAHYALTSGNNDLYAGTPGTKHLIFFDNVNLLQNVIDFKNLVMPADLFSFSEMPSFINSNTPPFDLHINAAIPTQIESGGSIVTSPVNIISDYSNTPRYPYSSYPNNVASPATAPDAGAYEFAGIHQDLLPPSFIYTPLPNTALLSNRTFTVTILDATGVPILGSGSPVCYWKINSGSYSAAQGIKVPGTNDYVFTFGAGVALGDVVSYYLVAQDVVNPANIGSSPSLGANGYSSSPPACYIPPDSPNTYLIVPSLSGEVTVGTGGTYPSLTGIGGLFADINSKALTGNLTAKIISNLSESGLNSLNKWISDAPSAFSVTIVPNSATERLIQGDFNGAMIRFSGAEYAIIDGRFNGSGKYLRFRNNNTSNSDFEFLNSARYDTLRSCYWESGNLSTTNATAGVIRFSISTGTVGNCNNVVMDNVIRDLSTTFGPPRIGIFSLGSSNALNSNNVISGNEITNFFVNGIFISDYNGDHWTISGNSFYFNITGVLSNLFRAINFLGGSQSNGNIIAGNYFGGTAPLCGGSPYVLHADPGTSIACYYVLAGSTTPTEIYNNVVSNLELQNTGSGSLYGIICGNSGAYHVGNLGGNIIGSATTPNSIVFDGVNSFRGILILGSTLATTVENNIVGNISWAVASGSQATIHGLSIYAAKVSRNKIFNIGTLLPGFIPTITGIQNFGVSGVYNEYTNNIVDLDGGSATNPTLYGFYDNGGALAGSILSYNTISIHGAATTFSSSNAWRKAAASTNILMDNIFSNTRTVGGVGAHYAVYNVVPNNFTSDYNDIFSLSGMLGYSGSSNITTLPGWQAATSGDSHSLSYNPNFASVNDLHPTNVLLNDGGIPIAGITSDYDGVTRGTPPDMGAYEFGILPPNVITTAATAISSNAATLNGIVNPNGSLSNVSFEFGLTTAYGTILATVPGSVSGTTAINVNASVSGLLPFTTYHFRVFATNVNGTTYGNDLTFTTSAVPSTIVTLPASNIIGASATLNGSANANYALTNITFEWGLSTSYGNTVNATPASVSGNIATPVSVSITGLVAATMYHFRCVGNGPGGIVYGADVIFTADCPAPAVPGTISGPQNVCKNSTGVVYSVAPVAGATGYNWILPTGATITSGANTNSITVSYSGSSISGNVVVNGINSCGPGNTSFLAVVVNDIPVPTISGPTSGCENAQGFIYTTEAGMANYTWSVSGGTIISGASTNSITVSWQTAGIQSVNVNYSNSNGCFATVPASYPVSIIALPVPTISGQNVACETSLYLDYTTEPGMTNYIWDMSPNSGTISQTGTNVVTIFWTSPGAKWVSVSYTNANGCTALTPTVYNVNVNPLPSVPGTISGPSTVCAGASGVAYSVTAVANTDSYLWSVPSGANIVSGAGTNSITVNFSQSAISGNITVNGQNSCGNGPSSPTLAVTVNMLPAAAGIITGETTICQGTTGVTYNIPVITGATSYSWNVPVGSTIISGATTNSIVVDFGASAISGYVSVMGINTCGSGTPSSKIIVVNTKPATPVITQNQNILSSNAPSGNQWYRDGVLIAGATEPTYEVVENGTYTVIVTINGCSSDTSNGILMVNVSSVEHQEVVVNVYPNPTSGEFWLSVKVPGTSLYEMEMQDILGTVVYKKDKLEVYGTLKLHFNFSELPSGVYTLVLRSSSNLITRKIVITR